MIGFVKGDRTSQELFLALYKFWVHHPQIVGGTRKEIYFFSNRYQWGWDWYLAQIPNLDHHPGYLTIYASHTYFWWPEAIERIIAKLPDAFFILIFRNPIDCAYSVFQQVKRDGEEMRIFDQAVTEELKLLASDQTIDVRTAKFWHRYVSEGIYGYFLRIRLAKIPRSKFLVLKADELYAKLARVMHSVFDFLELSLHEQADFPMVNQASYTPISAS